MHVSVCIRSSGFWTGKLLPYKKQGSELKFCHCPYSEVFPWTFIFFQNKYVLCLCCLQRVGGNISCIEKYYYSYTFTCVKSSYIGCVCINCIIRTYKCTYTRRLGVSELPDLCSPFSPGAPCFIHVPYTHTAPVTCAVVPAIQNCLCGVGSASQLFSAPRVLKLALKGQKVTSCVCEWVAISFMIKRLIIIEGYLCCLCFRSNLRGDYTIICRLRPSNSSKLFFLFFFSLAWSSVVYAGCFVLHSFHFFFPWLPFPSCCFHAPTGHHICFHLTARLWLLIGLGYVLCCVQ